MSSGLCALLAAATVVMVLGAGCLSGDEADDERSTEPDMVMRSIDAANRAVDRVEAYAAQSVGPAARRARTARRVLEKWYGTHVAVFAVDSEAARGRIRWVLERLAAISPDLVKRDRAGVPTDMDEHAVANILKPDGRTRAVARREGRRIEHELGVLADVLADQPAGTVVEGETGEPGSATADDVLIGLQERLRLLYPDLAAQVLKMRITLPR